MSIHERSSCPGLVPATKEGDGGVLMNGDTNAPFTYKDACGELNPRVGGNPTTAAESRKAVEEFLQALFKLG